MWICHSPTHQVVPSPNPVGISTQRPEGSFSCSPVPPPSLSLRGVLPLAVEALSAIESAATRSVEPPPRLLPRLLLRLPLREAARRDEDEVGGAEGAGFDGV